MADEGKPGSEGQATQRKKLPLKSILILAVIMLLEGGMFAAWMLMADPNKAGGAVGESSGQSESTVERQILRFRGPNRKTGRLVLYDIEIAVECDKEDAGRIETVRKKRDAYIRDRIRAIIARAEPQYFEEEELPTLKRQIQAVFDDVFGEGRIQRVLIPDCTPYRADW